MKKVIKGLFSKKKKKKPGPDGFSWKPSNFLEAR